MQILSAEYEKLHRELSELLADEKDLVANAAMLTALLYRDVDALDWVGIYFLRNGELVVGPFQGRLVKSRLPLGRSYAGRVVRDLAGMVVEHRPVDGIAEDTLERTQVIVPLMLHDRCVGVLGMDSPFAGRFDDHDRAGLEALARTLITTSDTTLLIPRRNTSVEVRTAQTVAPQRAAVPPPPERERTDVDPLPETERPSQVTGAALRIFASPVVVKALAVAVAVFLLSAHVIPAAVDTQLSAARIVASLVAYILLGTLLGLAFRSSLKRTTVQTAGIGVIAIVVGVASAMLVANAQTNIALYCTEIAWAIAGGYLGAAIGRALRRRFSGPVHSRHRVAANRRP